MIQLPVVITALAYLWIVRTALSYVHLWFVKEYRSDRMLIHLKTKQGKRILFPEPKLPPLSPKTLVMTGVLAAAEAAILILVPVMWPVRILIGYFMLFPLSWALAAGLYLPTFVLHTYRIAKAVRKLRTHAPMTVVGLTGSYGKTSTKEYLATILGSKLPTLKTVESRNSPIGIAETVLSSLTTFHKAFVVEMGAYRPGEVAKMTSMVRPEVGIITAINAQHQDLFKSIETTKKAKYELLAGLTGRRIAVVNADNPHTVEMGQWAGRDGCTVWGYGSPEATANKLFSERFSISSVSSDSDSVSFTLTFRGRKYPVRAPIRGEHFAWNLTGAIAGAVAVDIDIRDAIKAVEKVTNVRKVLQLTTGPKKSVFINDTFNNNPDAAVAALSFLKKYTHKRYLVFQPMIELGSYAKESHIRVGREAAAVCDGIILTNDNFAEWFIEGARARNPKIPVVIRSGAAAAEYLAPLLSTGDAVLYKGKEAEFVLKAFPHD